MVANQTELSSLDQRSVFKSLVAEKCKLCEIYRRMCNVYGEACFSLWNFEDFLRSGAKGKAVLP